jgi:hypothetical protein
VNSFAKRYTPIKDANPSAKDKMKKKMPGYESPASLLIGI